MRKTDYSADCLDAISADLLFSPSEFSGISPGLWDTYLNPETICHVKDDNGSRTGISRDTSLSLTDISGEEDDSTDSSWLSQEDDAILDKYTLALTLLDAQGEFSSMLLDEDFTGALFQEDAVDALTLGGTPLPPDLPPLRQFYTDTFQDIGQDSGSFSGDDSGQDSMQPIDYSLNSRLNDFLPTPSLDDLPELKPCPVATAENDQECSETENMQEHIPVNVTTNSETPPQRFTPAINEKLASIAVTKVTPPGPRRKRKRKLKEKEPKKASKKRTLVSLNVTKEQTQARNKDLNLNVIKLEYDVKPTCEEKKIVLKTENGCDDKNLTIPQNNVRVSKRPGRRPGQPSRVYHLWEFLRDLLLSTDYCPTHVHWIDQPNGVFRIAKSEEVAQLWGQKKRTKRNMTYEKMSRAIRFSREAGYFGPLPKNGDYPKKLCFKFGPRAYDWIDQLNATAEKAIHVTKLEECKPEAVDTKQTIHWKKRKVLMPT